MSIILFETSVCHNSLQFGNFEINRSESFTEFLAILDIPFNIHYQKLKCSYARQKEQEQPWVSIPINSSPLKLSGNTTSRMNCIM